MLEIKKISGLTLDGEAALEDAFSSLEPMKVSCCNWPDRFPYTPKVELRMFHTGDRLFVRFDVTEDYTAALVGEDNGEVWTDSCVEFFIQPDAGYPLKPDDENERSNARKYAPGIYYNFETTCIGTMLLGARRSRVDAELAPEEVLNSVARRTSLPRGETFAEKEGENKWSLILSIPPTALFRHDIHDWSGVKARINAYKCGDGLTHPHFLSWQPVLTEEPDFHRPEFFAEVRFED